MSMFKDLISKVTLGISEENTVSDEEIQGAVNEYQEKDTEIESLRTQLEQKSKEYEDLKNRVIENLFNNPKGKPEVPATNPGDDEQPKPKSFKDLIDPEYEIKN